MKFTAEALRLGFLSILVLALLSLKPSMVAGAKASESSKFRLPPVREYLIMKMRFRTTESLVLLQHEEKGRRSHSIGYYSDARLMGVRAIPKEYYQEFLKNFAALKSEKKPKFRSIATCETVVSLQRGKLPEKKGARIRETYCLSFLSPKVRDKLLASYQRARGWAYGPLAAR